ncbi:MAG: ion transporter [Candidatus Limimorpha sp.]
MKKLFAKIKTFFKETVFNNQKAKDKLYTIIFESDTKLGKTFDVVLIFMIITSVLVLVIDSKNIPHWLNVMFGVLEYTFTGFFTIEYILRIYCSPQPKKYALSFFGIIDFLSTFPIYFSFIFKGARFFLALRIFRVIRIFRVFKLFNFLNEGHNLLLALKDSMRKIIVFFLFIVVVVISIGTLMYIIENNHPESQFVDIPTSIYWAIVTMTTVGYGDITPITQIGRFLSAIVMLIGYTTIAVPTGIVSVSMAKTYNKKSRVCPKCKKRETDEKAKYCKYCGSRIDDEPETK